MAGEIDLAKAFKVVAKNLAENQSALNQADDVNHDHGDNIVQVFQQITKAVSTKKDAGPSEQLAYASQYLARNNKSGSGQVFSQNLAEAADLLKGQQLTPDKSINLINALLGGSQASSGSQSASAAGDLLGALLGGGQASSGSQSGNAAGELLGALLGGGQASSGSQSGNAAGDLLGALLGGGQVSSGSQPASGAGDLLGALLGGATQQQGAQAQGGSSSELLAMGVNVALKYMAAKKQGLSDGEALTQALVSGSRTAQTPHRALSANIIASTLLNLLSPSLKG